MSGKTVNSAILLLVLGNAMALVSDVFIKLLEPGAPILQFAFLRCLITLAFLVPVARKIDRNNLFSGFRVHAIRAHIHLVGLLCMVVALSNLPLATANAVFYVAPIMVMVLSVLFFRESLTPLSVFAVVSGFFGIIVILRPMDFNWAAIAALGSALALAINAVMVRKLPKGQTTVHKLFLNYPYRQVDANQVTSAEYTGLIWAVAIGWIWFNEVPDWWFLVGSMMVVVPLVLIGLNQRRKAPARGFNPVPKQGKPRNRAGSLSAGTTL